jgi:hypothetical protein
MAISRLCESHKRIRFGTQRITAEAMLANGWQSASIVSCWSAQHLSMKAAISAMTSFSTSSGACP